MRGLLEIYGQWVLAFACMASAFFVVLTTFIEYEHHQCLFLVRGLRVRFFRWWRHELTFSQVVLDTALFITLLPSMLMTVFGINFLSMGKQPPTISSMVYYCAGLTGVGLVIVWRADATARAKSRERRALEREEHAPGSGAPEDGFSRKKPA